MRVGVRLGDSRRKHRDRNLRCSICSTLPTMVSKRQFQWAVQRLAASTLATCLIWHEKLLGARAFLPGGH
jgi:hypothetical protein